MTKLQQILAYLPILGLLCVLAGVAFHYGVFQQITLILTGVFFVGDYVVNQRWKCWQWTRDKWAYVLPIVMWLLIVVWRLLAIEPLSCHTHLERQMPFLILGLVGIATISNVCRKEWFAAVALTVVVVQSIWIFCHVSPEEWFVNANSVFNGFNFYRCQHGHSHMAFNLYANMALVLGFAALISRDTQLAWKIGIGVEMAFTVGVLSITDGRTGLLTMVLLVGIMLFVGIWRYRKWLAMAVLIVCSIAGGWVVMNGIKNHPVDMKDEPRRVIFNVATHQIKQRPIIGYGAQTGHEEFVKRGLADEQFYHRYAITIINNPQYGIERVGVMHPHNAFLEAWIAHGILGLLVLLGVLITPVIVAAPKQRIPVMMCCLVYAIQAMFERIGNDLSPLLFMIVLLIVMQADKPAHSETVEVSK